MQLRHLVIVLAILAGSWNMGSEAWARKWKPSPAIAAQEYLAIEHNLSEKEFVTIIWMAPEYFEDTAENKAIRDLFQKYLVVGVMHGSINQFGEWTIEKPLGVTADKGHSQPLASISQEDKPPLLITTIEFLKRIMAGGLGQLGGGIEYFVFDGTPVKSCAKGTVWVTYLSERYEYQTPIPGCK